MLNVVILGKGEWVQSDAVNRKLFFFFPIFFIPERLGRRRLKRSCGCQRMDSEW